MSCSSCLQSKNVSLNQEVPQISAGISPRHAFHVQHPKLVLQIKNLMILLLVSSHVMFIMFTVTKCVLKSKR